MFLTCCYTCLLQGAKKPKTKCVLKCPCSFLQSLVLERLYIQIDEEWARKTGAIMCLWAPADVPGSSMTRCP